MLTFTQYKRNRIVWNLMVVTLKKCRCFGLVQSQNILFTWNQQLWARFFFVCWSHRHQLITELIYFAPRNSKNTQITIANDVFQIVCKIPVDLKIVTLEFRSSILLSSKYIFQIKSLGHIVNHSNDINSVQICGVFTYHPKITTAFVVNPVSPIKCQTPKNIQVIWFCIDCIQFFRESNRLMAETIFDAKTHNKSR